MSDIKVIRALQLRPGMVILNGGKATKVESIEIGDGCGNVHVNVVRRPTFIKGPKGKYVPNPEGRRIVYSDGCYDRTAVVTVQLPMQDTA